MSTTYIYHDKNTDFYNGNLLLLFNVLLNLDWFSLLKLSNFSQPFIFRSLKKKKNDQEHFKTYSKLFTHYAGKLNVFLSIMFHYISVSKNISIWYNKRTTNPLSWNIRFRIFKIKHQKFEDSIEGCSNYSCS